MVQIKSIMCEDVQLPPAGSRVTYRYISGGSYPNYEWAEVSSFLADGSTDDVIRAADSLRTQSGDEHHVFIEGFDLVDGSYEIILGS